MAKKKVHFRSVDQVQIHTSREGTCGEGDCKYRNHVAARGYEPHEAHHVLCVSAAIAFKDEYEDAVVEKIAKVYNSTKWCVNQKPNMLWLPLKSTYSGNAKGDVAADVWTLKLPCHNWDHNCKQGYTDEVIDEFRARIWNKIKDSPSPEGECFEEKDLRAALQNLEAHLQSRLQLRGKRGFPGGSGTDMAIRSAGKVDRWWLPFSMAKTSVAVNRRVSSFGQRPRTVRR